MFKLTLVTPEKKLETNAEVEEVTLPAFRGELNILPGHSPMMTTLTTGLMRYKKVGEDLPHYAAISWGYCQVSPEGVNVLAELAEKPSEINLQEALASEKELENKLGSEEMDEATYEVTQRKIAMARARQEAAEHAKTSL